ncbi:hypothetical protein [Paenibacillus senegalensis]|uniref:hypothetical protein n=1 Tax=Paenibacillus senegalensis TaxID=1465766 RepID=UPI0002F4B00B|nr:hypothetical protein [Paenibacillus senegalensis]
MVDSSYNVEGSLAITDSGNIPIPNNYELYAEALYGEAPIESKLQANNSCPNPGMDGYHYIVKGQYGRYSASGDINFPHSINVTSWDNKQNEVPYYFFQVYQNTYARGGLDAGLFYNVFTNTWHTFISGWWAYWDSGRGRYEVVPVWASVNANIRSNQQVNMVVTTLDNAINIRVVDRSNWKLLANHMYHTNSNHQYDSRGTYTTFGKETSFATHCYNPTSGAYMRGAFWTNVYFYWTSGYRLLNTQETSSTEWKPDRLKVTEFSNIIPHYQDRISIEYR